MVFFHGYLSSKESFAAQLGYFSRFCRVTALDFPGFGGAEPLTEPYSVADYAPGRRRRLRRWGWSGRTSSRIRSAAASP